MSVWTLQPRDPLAVRDGRPNEGRSESATLPFPYPGTIAGMIRTRLGSDDRGVFVAGHDLASLRRVAIRGPLLARLDAGELVVPRPRDAVVTGGVLRRLAPIERPAGALFDDALCTGPVGFSSGPSLPAGKAEPIMAWWTWDLLERWLVEPGSLEGGDAATLLHGGLPDLPVEARSHVKLTEAMTAEDGMLFQTRGLRFVIPPREPLALAVDVDPSTLEGRTLRPGIGPSGGERRLVRWQAASDLSLPALPGGVRAALSVKEPSVRVRIVLLTPAIFAEGWMPGAGPEQLLGPHWGVTPKLVAACVPRPETISGWDFEKQQPKPTRRLVSAGSIYWLDLEGTPDDRVRWADEVMMTNVSDAEQDRNDGFGLAAVGVGA